MKRYQEHFFIAWRIQLPYETHSGISSQLVLEVDQNLPFFNRFTFAIEIFFLSACPYDNN